jgi:hypothetical protein
MVVISFFFSCSYIKSNPADFFGKSGKPDKNKKQKNAPSNMTGHFVIRK